MRSYLVVDDNRAMAENLAEIIRDRGDEVVVARSGKEAMQLAAQRPFDAVLTDMRMPVMNGAELLGELHRIDPGLPAIVITAFTNDSGIEAAEKEAPLAVLAKPVPVPQLLHLLGVARRNGRVVLIEDDAVLSDNLAEVLQQQGFSVVRLGAIGQIDALPSERPLVGLVDVRVPGGPAGEGVRRLAQRFPGLPLLVMTGYRDEPMPAEAYRLFLKPFDTGELLAAVQGIHGSVSAPLGSLGGGVLLVEDSADLTENLVEILQGAGHPVQSASSCSEARDRARNGFDVALVDVRLPDGDGIGLAPELKALAPDAEVILLTGFAAVESAVAAVRAGVWAYLLKPVPPPDLLIAVDQAMSQVRLKKEKRVLSRRAQVAEKLAAVGTMAAGVAHEIRNPLNAAQLQLKLAERRVSAPARDVSGALESIGLVRAELERLNGVVEEILAFARPSAMNLGPGDLSQTVGTVARFMAPDVASRGVTLHVAGAERPMPARFDEARIKQVVINLVRNAAEAAGEGGEVWLSLRRQGDVVELLVEDSGPGLDEDVDPFVPFFTTKEGGTGLGLPTAHRIVSEHGGTLYLTRRDARTAFVAQIPTAG